MSVLGRLWRVLRAMLLALAALWFFLEEFGWHPLAAWLRRFALWPPWARLEGRIAAAPPRLALMLFLLPAGLLLPVKLLALALISDGHAMSGLAVIVAAKLVGTAVGGWLFLLTRPQLMQMPRFARAMAWWRRLRWQVRKALNASAAWRALRQTLQRWRRRRDR
ncbi:MAG TPA: hypothetical protein VNU48_04790 [Burkholderiaceae bacterium]|nr:hypothetical protein [Burkholderiaceae bacterium]